MSNRGTRAVVQTAEQAQRAGQGRAQLFSEASRIDAKPAQLDASALDTLALDTSAIDTSVVRINPGIDDVDTARVEEYTLLAALLARAPDAALLRGLSAIRGNSTQLGSAHAALAQSAAATTPERLEREYFKLFIGLGRGELLPYGSYYLTGFLHERPLARLRGDLAEIGIVRAAQHYEPEDHIAILCEIMAGLVEGRFVTPEGSEQRIFERHLAPWAARFFADLEATPGAQFYRHVGRIGRLFMEIETEAFALMD